MEVMPYIATESVELQLCGPTTSGYSSPVILVSDENVVKRLKKNDVWSSPGFAFTFNV